MKRITNQIIHDECHNTKSKHHASDDRVRKCGLPGYETYVIKSLENYKMKRVMKHNYKPLYVTKWNNQKQLKCYLKQHKNQFRYNGNSGKDMHTREVAEPAPRWDFKPMMYDNPFFVEPWEEVPSSKIRAYSFYEAVKNIEARFGINYRARK